MTDFSALGPIAFGITVYGDAGGDHHVLVEQDDSTTLYAVRGLMARAIAFHGALPALVELIRSVGTVVEQPGIGDGSAPPPALEPPPGIAVDPLPEPAPPPEPTFSPPGG